MKIGPVEGNTEEIQDSFENHGLNVEDYLQKPEIPLHWRWFVIPVSLFIISIMSSQILVGLFPKINISLFLLGGGGTVWLSASTQIRFKSPWATGVVAIGFLLMLLVGFGFLEPNELPKVIKTFNGQ